ncbi:MAG: arsenate reductase ArsC [Bacteroidales bacterium]
MKILILCTGNSSRSQIAEAILRRMDNTITVVSAGTNPAPEVHPFVITALAEIGIDISEAKTKDVMDFTNENWDYLITVCDVANETCPTFSGVVGSKMFIKFDNPLSYEGNDEFILDLVRSTRDKIAEEFEYLYQKILTKK